MSVDVVEAIVEVAKEVSGSELDWGMLAIDEEQAYRLMAMSTLENKGLDNPLIARAVVTSLLVENFVLNFKLLTGK